MGKVGRPATDEGEARRVLMRGGDEDGADFLTLVGCRQGGFDDQVATRDSDNDDGEFEYFFSSKVDVGQRRFTFEVLILLLLKGEVGLLVMKL